ncbi:hypothetical protein ACIPL1_26155 [Pseudomonas sp. NPDC090202]|uniref:hypothetical protein n=1 Tax=unclassified Pseudomonas TaxID=196821 RepID=UPI0038157913
MGLSITILTGLSIIDALVLFWIARFKIDDYEAKFSNSKLIVDAKKNWTGAGLLGRQMRLSAVMSGIVFSSLWAREGLINSDEVKSLPLRLKYWIWIPFATGTGTMATLITLLLITEKLSF